MARGKLITSGLHHLKVHSLNCLVVGIHCWLQPELSLLVGTLMFGFTMCPFELHHSMAVEF